MLTFMKAQTASLIAWLVDLAVMKAGMIVFGLWYVLASFIGNVAGALTHFTLGRSWVFRKADRTVVRQVIRYAIVWCGYAALTAGVVYLFTDYMQLDPLLSKVLTSVLISVGYNYPLQKRFVFK